MNGLLRSLRRVLIALAISVILILILLAAVVRQPSTRSLTYPKGPRTSADALRRHVEFFTTTVRPRGADQPENLDRAVAYIGERFREAGARVSEQTFTERGRTYRNVIADFGPLSGDKLIVGAHYDAFTSTGDLPGADDNASGTAGLLE